jgi:hypothetical protein
MVESDAHTDTDPELPATDEVAEAPAAVEENDETFGAALKVDTSAINDIYYDGKNYFMRSADGTWRGESSSAVTSCLKVRGFSDKTPAGMSFSRMDQIKEVIRRHRRVDGAAPFIYHPGDLWSYNGKTLLNVASVRVHDSADISDAWGVLFPRYAAVLDNVFAEAGYRDIFLTWLKRFYMSAEAGKVALGQAMALVGPVHCYKSFLIERLLTPAMGGYADLSSLASGESNGFNAEVFSSPLAVIDDARSTSNDTARQRYSAVIKKLTAHGKHKFHEKYLTPCIIEWRGRVVIAINDDAESIRMLPDLDISNADKIIALQMKSWVNHPDPSSFDGLEDSELHHFLAWLKAWTPPAGLVDNNSRYGMPAFLAPAVKEAAFASSSVAGLSELILAWWKRGGIDRRKAGPWIGNATDLLTAITDELPGVDKGLNRYHLGRQLTALSNREGSRVELIHGGSKKHKGANRFRIYPPEEGDDALIVDEPF